MERLRVPATKSSLLRLKEELAFAREGKSLLTQKREVLVMEMLRLQDDAQRVRNELDRLLAKAYEAFAAAADQHRRLELRNRAGVEFFQFVHQWRPAS
jgi:V/A-type H+-transporting ATPase subunit D